VAPDERILNVYIEPRKMKDAKLEVVDLPPGYKMPK
jgi:hypothetical protein